VSAATFCVAADTIPDSRHLGCFRRRNPWYQMGAARRRAVRPGDSRPHHRQIPATEGIGTTLERSQKTASTWGGRDMLCAGLATIARPWR
jgi:hypothetical protein